ncbi:MAG: hypothetical protein ABW034_18565 [Steroidobacteraceae bacterium]
MSLSSHVRRALLQMFFGLFVAVGLCNAQTSLTLTGEEARSQSGSGLDLLSGYSVAVDGTVALMGVPAFNEGLDVPAGDFDDVLWSAGRVAVFTRVSDPASETHARWQRTGTLKPPDLVGGLEFGTSVAIDGNIAVVGANDTAYVFRRSAGAWQHLAKLSATNPENTPFKVEVEYERGILLMRTADGLRVYHVSPQGKIKQTALLRAGALNGGAFATDGTVIAVGAPADNTALSGSVHLYRYIKHRWVRVNSLDPTDAQSVPTFGTSVAIRGGALLVGAARTFELQNKGAVYVFVRGPRQWQQTQKIEEPPMDEQEQYYHRFGDRIAIARTRVVIGNVATTRVFYGDVRTYVWNGGQLEPAEVLRGAEFSFGFDLDLSLRCLIVGEPQRYFQGDPGSAKVFELDGE